LDKSASGWSAGRRDVLNAISKDSAMAVIKSIYQNASALDFAMPSASEFDRSAAMLLKRGYAS